MRDFLNNETGKVALFLVTAVITVTAFMAFSVNSVLSSHKEQIEELQIKNELLVESMTNVIDNQGKIVDYLINETVSKKMLEDFYENYVK